LLFQTFCFLADFVVLLAIIWKNGNEY
jgi:hypothetical protein